MLTHLVSRDAQDAAIEAVVQSDGHASPLVLTLCGRTYAELKAAGDHYQLAPGVVLLEDGTELCPLCALEFTERV